VKTLIAVVGGSALVVMGAASIAMAHGQDQPTQMISSGTMNMGPTSTIETPPSVPGTSVAAPAVKAGS
jgi:hypothetical protein